MDGIFSFLVTFVVTTIAFVIITFIPTGVESDSFGKTATTALIFGVLNAIFQFVLTLPVLGFVVWVITLGKLLMNLILFGLSAKLVEGFRLRWGVVSAILGAFLLSVLTPLITPIVGIFI